MPVQLHTHVPSSWESKLTTVESGKDLALPFIHQPRSHSLPRTKISVLFLFQMIKLLSATELALLKAVQVPRSTDLHSYA